MHKIDSDGATVNNLFTEGNATLSIPATVVSAAIANAWQEEIVNVVEGVGISLLTSSTDTFDQMKAAIQEWIRRGGRTSPVIQAVNNNQASLADVTGFPQIDTVTVIAFEFLYSIFRRTDSANKKESGRAFATYNSETAAWEITTFAAHEGAGVVMEMTLVSGTTWKLQYTSDNMAGASYVGTLRATDIKTVRVS